MLFLNLGALTCTVSRLGFSSVHRQQTRASITFMQGGNPKSSVYWLSKVQDMRGKVLHPFKTAAWCNGSKPGHVEMIIMQLIQLFSCACCSYAWFDHPVAPSQEGRPRSVWSWFFDAIKRWYSVQYCQKCVQLQLPIHNCCNMASCCKRNQQKQTKNAFNASVIIGWMIISTGCDIHVVSMRSLLQVSMRMA